MSTLNKGMAIPHNCDERRLCTFIPVGGEHEDFIEEKADEDET